jgi:hypothetical protein
LILNSQERPRILKYLGADMAKRRRARWTAKEHRELRAHSKARTPVVKISKKMKRAAGALRQQAFKLGIFLGHQR